MKINFILFSLVLFLFSSTNAQDQATLMQQESEFTYIFKISDKQVFQLYESPEKPLADAYFEQLIDSFPTGEDYQKSLPQGHYIKTSAQKNIQQTYYQSIKDFDVFTFNNAKDLIVQVYNKNAEIIEDAEVYVGNKKLGFSEVHKAFVDKKSNKKGILKVKHKGFTAFYHLSRAQNSSFLSRSSKNLAYKYPTKYVWLPIEYLAMLPVDGVRSIQNNNATGYVRKSKRFFVNLYEKVACWFDDYYCPYTNNEDYEVAYFVFNKPKFKPGDTLRGKTYIWDSKGKPVNQNLKVHLKKNYREKISLGEITPYTKGSYDLQLHLHDSLELELDKPYSIELMDTDGDMVTRNTFVFEEYELKGIQFTIDVNSTKQYQGEELDVSLNAKDENDLRILDARVSVELLSLSAEFGKEKNLFLPDTLWNYQTDLETLKATKFKIPDSIFPKTNLEYQILAKLTTSDQEYIEAKEQINYYHERQEIKHQVVGDSILVEFHQNGKKTATDVKIESLDHFGNSRLLFSETTPFQFRLDPLNKAYKVSASDVEKEIDVNAISSGISPQLYRTKDSVFIQVRNPHQYGFVYHIFKGNKEIECGFEKELAFAEKDTKSNDYSLSLNYVWAGKTIQRNLTVPINDKKLTVKVNQPQLIYPGQKVDVEIEVLDHKENPVDNATILAYGMTSKFDYSPPTIKNYSTKPKNRKFRNSFEISSLLDEAHQEDLNINRWNSLASLQGLDYYQLIYPKENVYTHEIQLENQPTQFAPFVVKDGEIIPVHIIYVDNKLIYLSDMTNLQPYSFEVGENPVNIQLRTKDHQINLDSIQFKAENKTIISLDINQNNPNIRVKEVPDQLTTSERNQLINHVMPYRLTERKFAYLKNDQRFHLLQHSQKSGYHRDKFVGPIHFSDVNFVQDKLYELTFRLEPKYKYFFQPNHLKQTSFQSYKYPNFLSNNNIPKFYDLVITEEKIETMSKLSLLNQKKHSKLFSYPKKTTKNKGTLQIEREGTPINIIISNKNNEKEFRIYSGKTNKIYELSPGDYRLIFFYSNETYSIENNIKIKANGINYYNAKGLKKRSADSFSEKISDVVSSFLIQQNKDNTEAYRQRIQQIYQQNVEYLEDGNLFRGKVTDFNNIALPGVNLIVKGTYYSTQSDFDGNFQLSVPKKYSKIQVEYLGFKTQIVDVDEFQFQQICLESDTNELNDIVLFANNNIRKYDQLVHSETIENNEKNTSLIHQLQGHVAGISIKQASGSPGVSGTTTLRGKSSLNSSNQPLYVINGVPYDANSVTLATDLIQDIQVLKDESAIGIYGNRGKNGVIIITTSQNDFQFEVVVEEDAVPEFATESSEANSMRTNFSDEAFWKPNLITNQDGKAKFSVTYPDDVTRWDTHFLVATEKQFTGQTKQNVKSYRPLISELSIPKFLTEGDSVLGIGKVKNYIKDSIAIATQFHINEAVQFRKEKEVADFDADLLPITATSTDSLLISYQLNRLDNDYLDGEELHIPVFPKGMKKNVGSFEKINQGDTLNVQFHPDFGDAELSINARLNEVLEEELEIVIGYLHNCNEQIASRLKAQLIKRKIYQNQNRNFDDDSEIKKLIRLLQKNQKSNSFWGWWANSSTNYWASLNVLKALLMADQQGFNVKWNTQELKQKLIQDFYLEENASKRIQMLQLMNLLNAEINFQQETKTLLRKKEELSLVEQLQLWEIHQQHGGEVPIDQLLKFQKEDTLGNWYMESESKYHFHPYKNNVQATIIAFRIFRAMDNQHEAVEKFRDYLILQRSFGGYANTFESIQLVEALSEETKNAGNKEANYEIRVNDSSWESHTVNSFSATYQASEQVQITNKSTQPLYINYGQNYMEAEPEKNEELFKVKSYFENEYGDEIKASEIHVGEPVQLKVLLTPQQKAEYVMIEIPIPSGFGYHNKKQFPKEAHRSYAKDKAYIFMEKLDAEEYVFEVELMPRFQGSYNLNPTKVMLMYFEHQHGNNETKQIQVGE